MGIPNGDCAESVWRMHGDCSVTVTRARERWRFVGAGLGYALRAAVPLLLPYAFISLEKTCARVPWGEFNIEVLVNS